LSKREHADFSRSRWQKNRSKWDADSNRYALDLTAKTKPLCLILFRHGGFFFSRLAQTWDVNSALETPILSSCGIDDYG
jgi:hypothetical protein